MEQFLAILLPSLAIIGYAVLKVVQSYVGVQQRRADTLASEAETAKNKALIEEEKTRAELEHIRAKTKAEFGKAFTERANATADVVVAEIDSTIMKKITANGKTPTLQEGANALSVAKAKMDAALGGNYIEEAKKHLGDSVAGEAIITAIEGALERKKTGQTIPPGGVMKTTTTTTTTAVEPPQDPSL